MKLVIFDWGRTLYDPETKVLFPETKEVLEHLKSEGFMLAIVALATAGQEKILERLGIIQDEQLAQYFVSIKFDTENKGAMYEDTIREHKVEFGDVTIVDDRVIRGIAWGNKHGCTTVWVQNGKFAQELPSKETGEPTYIIKTIGEIKNVG